MVNVEPHSQLAIHYSLFAPRLEPSAVLLVKNIASTTLSTCLMKRSKHVYEFAILIGLVAAVYLYGFSFDDFSETELVRLSYGWFAALVFGTHGLIACELKEVFDAGEAETPREALRVRRQTKNRSLLSIFASVALPSFLLITSATDRRPFLTALLATVIWIALLAFFFEAIFPSL